MFRDLILNPDVQFTDGVITEQSVTNILDAVQSALTQVDAELGTDVSSYVSSVIPLLRNSSSNLIPHVNYGVLISGCAESFVTNGVRYELALVPDDASAIIFSFGALSYIPTTSFTNSNEYTVVGRTLILASEPVGSNFTTSYNGYIPEDYGAEINHQSLYPNPINIADGKVSPPTVAELDAVNFVYSISVPNETYLPGIDDEFTTEIPNSIPQILSQYVNAGGAVETPLDYASVWVWNDVAGEYEKVELTSFKILSANSFVFTATETLDTNKTYVVSLFAKSVLGLLEELYYAYKNHTHDGYGNTRKISHDAIDSDPTVDYHKQYLRKEGYDGTDVENLMIGDLFIGSIDDSTGYSNIAARSSMIVFGDYAFGHAVYRDTGATGYLVIDGRASNGINITLETPLEGADGKVFIKSGESRLWNRLDVGDGKTSLVIYGGQKLYLTADEMIDIETLEARTINLYESAVVNFNGALFSSVAGGLTITTEAGKEINFDGAVRFTQGTFDGAAVDELVINENKEIVFKPTDETLKATSGGPIISYRLRLSDHGMVSVVAQDNTPPVSVSNIMKIESDNEVFVVYPVVSGSTIDGTPYSFREDLPSHTRIDRVQDWPRQDIYVGKIDSTKISIADSNFTDRRGIDVGLSGRIYSSADDATCSFDSLIFESKDDIIFLTYGDNSTDCENRSFSNIRVGGIIAKDEISTSGDVSALGTISAADVEVSGSIIADGDITTSQKLTATSIKTTGTLTASGDTSLQDVNITGLLTIGNLEVDGNGTYGGDLSIAKSMAVAGLLTVQKNVTFNSSVSVDVDVNANRVIAGTTKTEIMQVSGEGIISGTLTTSDINAKGNIVASGTVSSGIGIFSQNLSTKVFDAQEGNFSRLRVDGVSYLQQVEVSGGISVSESASVDGNLKVGDELVVAQGARISGGLAVTNGFETSGGANISGNLDLSGDFSSTGSITGNSANIGNALSVGSTLDVGGNFTGSTMVLTGRATADELKTANILLSEKISGATASKLEIGEILTGRVTIADRGESYDDRLISYVPVELLSTLTVAGLIHGSNVNATGSYSIGEIDDSTGIVNDPDAVFLTKDGLHFSKDTSILGVSNLTTKKMIGRVDLSGSEIAGKSNADGLVTAIQASKFTLVDNMSIEGICYVPGSFISAGTLFFNDMVPLDNSKGYVSLVAGAAVYE